MVTSDLWRVGLRVKHRRTRLRYTYIAGVRPINNLPVNQVRMAINCISAPWIATSPTRTQKSTVCLGFVKYIYPILKCATAIFS